MPPTWLLITFGVIAVALIVFESIRHHRKVARRRREALQSAGFQVFDRLKLHEKRERYAPFEHLTPRLLHGPKRLLWLAIAPPEPRIDPALRTHLFAHSHANSSGQTYHHTIAAFPCPPYWPELRIEPSDPFLRFLVTRIARRKQQHLQLEDAAFNKRWNITTADPDFAFMCLTPSIQAFINDHPGAHRRDTWWIGYGWICCLRAIPIRKYDRLIAFSQHPVDLFARIPIELAYYNAPNPDPQAETPQHA